MGNVIATEECQHEFLCWLLHADSPNAPQPATRGLGECSSCQPRLVSFQTCLATQAKLKAQDPRLCHMHLTTLGVPWELLNCLQFPSCHPSHLLMCLLTHHPESVFQTLGMRARLIITSRQIMTSLHTSVSTPKDLELDEPPGEGWSGKVSLKGGLWAKT